MTHILFFQLRRLQWKHVGNLWGSVGTSNKVKNHWLKLCFTIIIFEQKLNQSVDTSDCEQIESAERVFAERRQAPFTI